MKLKETLVAFGLSVMSLSVYAADQVVKEETTPPAPEGAITIAQIPPVYTPPPSAPAPAAQQAPVDINQPVGPSNTPSIPVQQPVMQQAPKAQQNTTNNVMPGQTQQQMATPGSNQQNLGPAQQQMMQQNGQQPVMQQNGQQPVMQQNGQQPMMQQNGQQPMMQQNGQQPMMQQNGQQPMQDQMMQQNGNGQVQ